jgi:hypothetical protein
MNSHVQGVHGVALGSSQVNGVLLLRTGERPVTRDPEPSPPVRRHDTADTLHAIALRNHDDVDAFIANRAVFGSVVADERHGTDHLTVSSSDSDG